MNGTVVETSRKRKWLRPIRRDVVAWEAIRGMWKGKRTANPENWQRKIRKEWERKSV